MATGNQKRRPVDTLAFRVRTARLEAGLSQREAALKCGLKFGEWQSIEGGAAARDLHKKIAAIAVGLEYDRDWLMWGGELQPEDGIAPSEVAAPASGGSTIGRKSGVSRQASTFRAA